MRGLGRVDRGLERTFFRNIVHYIWRIILERERPKIEIEGWGGGLLEIHYKCGKRGISGGLRGFWSSMWRSDQNIYERFFWFHIPATLVQCTLMVLFKELTNNFLVLHHIEGGRVYFHDGEELYRTLIRGLIGFPIAQVLNPRLCSLSNRGPSPAYVLPC